jgi:uncharacterized membrane protein
MTEARWRIVAFLAFGGLIALQLAWHLWLSPPRSLPMAFVLGLAIGPLIVAGLVMLADVRRGLFWAGFIALAYFSHGIMEAWSSPAIRHLANAEWLLSTILVVAVGAAGLAARKSARRQAATRSGTGPSAA